MSRRIVLASASPRRKDILQTAGYDFIVLPADVDEGHTVGSPEEIVMELAKRKAEECAKHLPEDIMHNEDGFLVIGSDTLVFLDEEQLGKPESHERWREYISRLSDNTHKVITGVCIITEKLTDTFCACTYVNVADMTEAEIDDFIQTGDDMDKAGGYGIQGKFAKYISGITGEYNNVVGFPIAAFAKRIKELEINI